MNKDQIVRAIRDERARTSSFLRGLEPDQFDTPTALPGWRLREVIAHLVTTDKASVLGANLPIVLGSMDRLERWNDRQVPKWADRPVPDLLIGLDRWGRRMRRLAQTMPSALYRLRVPTIFGRAPLGILIWSRVYDEWVHRQDMRRALGLPDEEVDLESPAEFLLTAIVWAVLPQVQGPPGQIILSLEDTPVPEWRFDTAARTGAPAAGAQEAAARVAGPAPKIIMSAAGRESFQSLQSEGVLKVEGDQGLSARFLANLRVV